MKNISFTAIIFSAIIFSCQNHQEKKTEMDTLRDSTKHPVKPITERRDSVPVFKSLTEVVNNYKIDWVKTKQNWQSCTLHFNIFGPDTLFVGFSLECCAFFPIKIIDNKIVVYWDTLVDYKYNWDIVKAIKQTKSSSIHSVFMILELANDTTLTAHYPNPALKNKLNQAWYRTWGEVDKNFSFPLFPDKFYASNEIMY